MGMGMNVVVHFWPRCSGIMLLRPNREHFKARVRMGQRLPAPTRSLYLLLVLILVK